MHESFFNFRDVPTMYDKPSTRCPITQALYVIRTT